MVHGKNRIPYWIDRSLNGLAGPDYDATISFGLPFELGDCPYGESRIDWATTLPGWIRSRRAIARGRGRKASGLWLALCHLPDQHHSAPNDDVMLLPTPNSAAVTREEKGKPRLQLRSL